MSSPKLKIPDAIQQALTDTGLPWAVVPGAKHWKIFVDHRMVGILPLKGGDERGRGQLNTIAQIRRAAR
jgi:hypothetical protein